jgi:hypothetical protein
VRRWRKIHPDSRALLPGFVPLITGWYRRLRGEGPLAPVELAVGGMLAHVMATA